MRYGLLQTGFNCLLQMPTGSGKTWLAERAIADVLKAGHRAIYLTPLRALADELSARWRQTFQGFAVGTFTGDYRHTTYPVPFGQARLLVMTPERLDACTRAWRSHWNWLPEVDLVVVDEFHLLGEPSRGPRLEGTLSRLRRLNPFARLLGLSATLGNRQELAEWLEGVDYVSSWRPIPLNWRFVRFRKADEKPALLATEVAQTRDAGGHSLVFVQSRRRAEALSRQLREHGLRAQHHHAGLARPERLEIEQGFRARQLDTIVATATLEMGLNLPVRQVILYDLQTFDGGEFRPLPTNNVWQRVGRAGRPGLDPSGEAVLFIPAWDRQAERYVQGRFEPVQSGLADQRAVAEQIVIEVSAGLARTPSQVRRVLNLSLAARQGRLPDVDHILDEMLKAELLCQAPDDDAERARYRLKATRLGWIAARHFLSPSTVLRFRQALAEPRELTFFDLLLLATSSPDGEPVLPVDFEDLDTLTHALAAEPSQILREPPARIMAWTGLAGKRLLSALKMALVARTWTRTGDADVTAVEHNCYGFEVVRLRESLDRLLLAMSAVLERPAASDPQPTPDDNPVSAIEKVRRLHTMIAAGLDEYAVALSVVKGLGPAWARRLQQAGIGDIEALAVADPAELTTIRGLSVQRAQKWIREAEERIKIYSGFRYREAPQPTAASATEEPRLKSRTQPDGSGHSGEGGPTVTRTTPQRTEGIDIYRLRRAFELKVTPAPAGGNTYLVTGGLEPHRVAVSEAGIRCDCVDARQGHVCKHTLAVRLARGDAGLHGVVSQWRLSNSEPHLNLHSLWLDNAVTSQSRR